MSIKDRWIAYKVRHGNREDVLPCPQCGSARTYTTGQFRPIGLLVECKACGLRGPVAQDRGTAILLWNSLDRDRLE